MLVDYYYGVPRPKARPWVCQSCKNEDTRRLVDFVDLQPFAEYHKGKSFKAYECHCCGAKWHFTLEYEDLVLTHADTVTECSPAH